MTLYSCHEYSIEQIDDKSKWWLRPTIFFKKMLLIELVVRSVKWNSTTAINHAFLIIRNKRKSKKTARNESYSPNYIVF